jgi:hypothetical protein
VHLQGNTVAKGPATWGRGAGPGVRASSRPRHYFTTPAVVLQVYRPSLRRWVTVAKLVDVGDELVLAIPYRHRQRLQQRVSLPLVVIRYAQEHGARAIIVRFDDERLAFRLPLGEALRLGWREPLEGQPELWLSLELFEECPWPAWPYTTRIIRLGPGPEELPRQLSLEEVRA